jgi:hypothetical protein
LRFSKHLRIINSLFINDKVNFGLGFSLAGCSITDNFFSYALSEGAGLMRSD